MTGYTVSPKEEWDSTPFKFIFCLFCAALMETDVWVCTFWGLMGWWKQLPLIPYESFCHHTRKEDLTFIKGVLKWTWNLLLFLHIRYMLKMLHSWKCRRPVWVWMGFEHLVLVEGSLPMGTRLYLRTLPTQIILWFYNMTAGHILPEEKVSLPKREGSAFG